MKEWMIPFISGVISWDCKSPGISSPISDWSSDQEEEKIPSGIFDGENTGGKRAGNSAVEAVPTPEENSVLFPYFLKRDILNGFRPCNLAALYFPQKERYLQSAGQTRV